MAGVNPASTVSGDFLLAEVTAAGASNSTAPDSNWIKVIDRSVGGIYKAVWRRFVTSATDGQGTWTATGGSSILVTVIGMSNVNTNPIRTSGAQGVTNSSSMTAPNLTGTVTNDEVFIFNGTDGGPRPWADSGVLLGCLPNAGPNVLSQSAMVTFENAANAKCAVGNTWAQWQFPATWPPTGNTTGNNANFANNRLDNVSWPMEQTWPQGNSGQGTAASDPTTTFTNICNGQYDTIFANNALQMQQWGNPIWFRPYCEMEGGDHPWEVGWVLSGNISTYVTKFKQAWQRLWIITKGTQAQVNALSPAYTGTGVNGGAAVQADNVLFFWNPTNTVQNASATRDNLYPGDAYVQMAGTEAYVPDGPVNNSYAQTLDSTLSGQVPIYSYFTGTGNSFSSGGKIIGHGESGNRWDGTTADTAPCVTRTNTFASVIQNNHPGVKMFIWWNGGSSRASGGNGISNINASNYPASVLTAVQNFMDLAYMHPTLNTSFATPAGWNELQQFRVQMGTTGTNYGANMAGDQTLHKTATGTSVTGPTVAGYAFADMASLAVAVVPSGSTGVPPSNTALPQILTNPPVQGSPVTTSNGTWSGDLPQVFSYQWKRNGGGNTGVVGSPRMAFGFESGTVSGITDNSGNNVTATPENYSALSFRSSQSGHGQALNFNFNNSNFLLVDNTSGAFDFPSWTVAAWVFLDPSLGPTNTGGGLRWEIMEHSQAFWVNIRNDTTPALLVRAGGFFGGSTSSTEYDSNTAIVPNTWTHIAVTYDQSNLKWYINGTLDKTQAQTGATNASTANPVAIGAKHRVSPSFLEQAYFNGAMDEYIMYNSALTGGQITSLMSSVFGSGVVNVGTNSNTYTPVAGDVGSTLTATVTSTNSSGSASATSPNSATVVASATKPVNTVLPVISGTTTVGQTLTTTNGTWTGSPNSFSYQWQRVATGGGTTNIGTNSSSYQLVAADGGTNIQVVVTATNGSGSTPATSQTVGPIGSVAIYPEPAGQSEPYFISLPATTCDTYTQFAGVVDSSSQANTEQNRAVYAYRQVGAVDYWGGAFTLATSPGGSQVTQNLIAAVNETTGALLSFNPNLSPSTGEVRCIAASPDGQFIYVGGLFSQSNGVTRTNLAKYKTSDGSLDASWTPSTNGEVRWIELSPDGNTAYLGGPFTTVNGSARNCCAAVTTSTGGLVSSFAPGFTDSNAGTNGQPAEVRRIRFAPGDNNHLYVIGLFDTVTNNSVTSTRLALCQVNVSDGSVTTWHPDTGGTTLTTIGHDICFMPDGSACFASFAGSDTGGDGNNTIRYEISPAARNARTWAVVLDGDNNCCDTNGTYVWIGTHGDGTQNLNTISNVGTKKICAVRCVDGTGGTNSLGQKTSLWQPNPQFNGIKGTYTINVTDDALKLGGTWVTPNQAAASFTATAATLQEFTISNDTISGAVLQPGQSATATLNFTPAVLGARTANITFTDNSGGSNTTQILVANGNGISSAPDIVTVPASALDFGSVVQGQTSLTQTITVQNNGNANLILGNINISGASNEFGIVTDNISSSTLVPGASNTIVMNFTPNATGVQSGVLTIPNNDDVNHTISLTGTGVAAGVPTAVVTPSSPINFPLTVVGQTSAPITVTVTNSPVNGSINLLTGQATITGSTPGSFAIVNDTFSNATISPSNALTLQVTYSPQTPTETSSATLNLPDNSGGNPNSVQTIALTGTPQASVPIVSLSSSTLSFPSQVVGQTSSAQTVTLTNTGNANLVVGTITKGGTNPTNFAVTADTISNTTITPGNSQHITVTFTPNAVGARSASLSIPDNAGNSPQTIGLSGSGTAAVPILSPNPTSLSFGTATIDSTSSPQTVTLLNNGTANLTFGQVSIGGSNPTQYALQSDLASGTTITPGSFKTVQVVFKPTQTGSKPAALMVPSNAGGSPLALPLSGTANVANVQPYTQTVYTPFYLSYGLSPAEGFNSESYQGWKATVAAPLGSSGTHTFSPPSSIASDFYPGDYWTGASGFPNNIYSSSSSTVLLNQCLQVIAAGIDVLMVSWSPPPDRSDSLIPSLLTACQAATTQTGIPLFVSFIIEPFATASFTDPVNSTVVSTGRSAANLWHAVNYINSTYGSHPNFYRTARVGWHYAGRAQGANVFFLNHPEYDYLISGSPNTSTPGSGTFWKTGCDNIHNPATVPLGGLILAESSYTPNNCTNSDFDGGWVYMRLPRGQYNAQTLDTLQFNRTYQLGFPPTAICVPAAVPGYSDWRIQDPSLTLRVSRDSGTFYDKQWNHALNGVAIADVAVTSWNNWGFGTQIEPATQTNGTGL